MNEFIAKNNTRILAGFMPVQERYRYKAENQDKQDIGNGKPSADERRFLLGVESYQYRFTLTQIYEMVGLSACKGNKVSKSRRKDLQ